MKNFVKSMFVVGALFVGANVAGAAPAEQSMEIGQVYVCQDGACVPFEVSHNACVSSGAPDSFCEFTLEPVEGFSAPSSNE